MFSLPFEVDESITIEGPMAEVQAKIQDFNEWPKWSPWLCQEPNCPYEVQGSPGQSGHQQEWNGEIIGSGNMVLKRTDGQHFEYDLRFLKPWKSNSKVDFFVSPQGDKTQVRWTMKGSIPVFLFFMRKMMKALVGSDYQRGLKMMKELVETGKVDSSVQLGGIEQKAGFKYLGIRRKCDLKDIGPLMSKDLETLFVQLKDHSPQKVLSFYPKFDFVTGTCEYISALTFDELPNGSWDQFEAGEIPDHKAFCVEHQGSYEHLGNAWSAAIGCTRAKGHKINKGISQYEIYHSDPQTTDVAELKTEICVPLKG